MQTTLYEAKCATCNQVTTVPFKHASGNPVCCKACFSKRLANQPSTTQPQRTNAPMAVLNQNGRGHGVDNLANNDDGL